MVNTHIESFNSQQAWVTFPMSLSTELSSDWNNNELLLKSCLWMTGSQCLGSKTTGRMYSGDAQARQTNNRHSLSWVSQTRILNS
jgi:hypothetical protein